MFKRNDWIVGIVSVILGVFVLITSWGWKAQTPLDTAGPGGFPRMVAWGILAIGIIHLIGAFIAPKKSTGQKADWNKEFQELKPVLQIALVAAIYLLILQYLGYLISTPLLIIGTLWVVNVRKIKSLLLTSIGTTIVLFLIFDIGLKVRLPMGFLSVFLK